MKDHCIDISMDGKGAWRDNVFVEHLWRSVKYEEVYLNTYESASEARQSLQNTFGFTMKKTTVQKLGSISFSVMATLHLYLSKEHTETNLN